MVVGGVGGGREVDGGGLFHQGDGGPWRTHGGGGGSGSGGCVPRNPEHGAGLRDRQQEGWDS